MVTNQDVPTFCSAAHPKAMQKEKEKAGEGKSETPARSWTHSSWSCESDFAKSPAQQGKTGD